MSKLIKKINISTTITLVTGLHIGGSTDSVEIGGIDSPVVKLATRNNQPYIPGSSLKGKMRCLLEQIDGEVGGKPATKRLFGTTDKSSRLIVRDAMLTAQSEKELLQCSTLVLPYTENKYENTIDRVYGTAGNPRQIERVPAGAVFAAEFVINIWDDDNEKELLELFRKGLKAVENDYLGGNGSRGYGQIRFGELHIEELSENNAWGINKQQ